jgi:hypothetical protein
MCRSSFDLSPHLRFPYKDSLGKHYAEQRQGLEIAVSSENREVTDSFGLRLARTVTKKNLPTDRQLPK